MPESAFDEIYMRNVDQFLRHRKRAQDQGVDVELIESEAVALVIDLETKRLKIDQERRAGFVSNILTIFVGCFVTGMPFLSRAAEVAAAWYGKTTTNNDAWVSVTCLVGMLAILGLQFPLVKTLFAMILKKPEEKK